MLKNFGGSKRRNIQLFPFYMYTKNYSLWYQTKKRQVAFISLMRGVICCNYTASLRKTWCIAALWLYVRYVSLCIIYVSSDFITCKREGMLSHFYPMQFVRRVPFHFRGNKYGPPIGISSILIPAIHCDRLWLNWLNFVFRSLAVSNVCW